MEENSYQTWLFKYSMPLFIPDLQSTPLLLRLCRMNPSLNGKSFDTNMLRLHSVGLSPVLLITNHYGLAAVKPHIHTFCD